MIEGQSLTLFNDLASHPPVDPDSALELGFDPLTLYIVRVPGTRDVFLTPIKPRDRVVNAQDVQHSLYFLHVDGPDDSLLDVDETRTVARKAIGSRPNRLPPPTPPASPTLEQHGGRASLDQTVLRKPLPARAGADGTSPAGSARMSMSKTSLASSHSGGSTAETSPHSLTLIRRDPASGQQWNVARIRDPPVRELSSDVDRHVERFGERTKNAGAPLYLELDSAGYANFVSPALPPRKSGGHDGVRPDSLSTPEERVFRRRVWMDGSRFADHSYTWRDSTQLAVRDTLPNQPSLRSSATSYSVDKRSKGYAFHDPWGNKCEFSTASTGRALKCRQIRNTHIAAQQLDEVPLSELRFNLPSSHFASRSESHATTAVEGRRKSFYSSRSTGDDLTGGPARGQSDERDELIDYSLGRERAGGGFGGRQTKLGKLIVHAMGLKMIDLTVAANLALWWRAYDRTSLS